MSWYQAFNLTEAVLWWVVAVVVWFKVPRATRRQRGGVILAAISFVAFGITDVIEADHERSIPLWLWGWKCLCGVGILTARYTWLGWSKFHWKDREFLFGLACLVAVIVILLLQFGWPQPATPSNPPSNVVTQPAARLHRSVAPYGAISPRSRS